MLSSPTLRIGAAVSLGLLSGCRGGTLRSPEAATVTMQLDYAGAEVLLDRLEADALDDGDVDDMLAVHGLHAMVDNVTRFVPSIGVAEFRQAIRAFAAKNESASDGRYFQLDETWESRAQIRTLIAVLRREEKEIVRRTLAMLEPYRPDTGPLTIRVYFVAGGVSDGFVFDDRPEAAFYANLTRADGDRDATLVNMAHEAFHVMQKAAQRRTPGLAAVADDLEALPPIDRLFATVLLEGTASYIVDPRASAVGSSPSLELARERYRRNTEPQRLAESFALLDTIVGELDTGQISWGDAYERGFAGHNDARLYFVGYEMTRAIEHDCGTDCVKRLFERPPVEFFRQYIALYRGHTEITARFAPATERLVAQRGP